MNWIYWLVGIIVCIILFIIVRYIQAVYKLKNIKWTATELGNSWIMVIDLSEDTPKVRHCKVIQQDPSLNRIKVYVTAWNKYEIAYWLSEYSNYFFESQSDMIGKLELLKNPPGAVRTVSQGSNP